MNLKMHFIVSLFFLFSILSSCNTRSAKKVHQQEETPRKETISLKPLWVCDSLLITPESVIYDVERDRLYVSNINTGPWEKNGDGFIAILSLNGEVLNQKWITGLNSPKGMGIVDSILYVADIDRVVKIDINSGKKTGEILIPDEDGLNDISVGDNGEVFVSSSTNSIVYNIVDDGFKIILKHDDVRFNGLFAEGDNIFIITSKTGQLLDYNMETEKLDTLVDDLGQGDGLKGLENKEFLTSDWQGEVFYVNKNMDVQSILKTKQDKINSADIEFIKEKNILVVPTFFDNKVVAYSLIKEDKN